MNIEGVARERQHEAAMELEQDVVIMSHLISNHYPNSQHGRSCLLCDLVRATIPSGGVFVVARWEAFAKGTPIRET